MSQFGDAEWGKRRGGRLTSRERAGMVLSLLQRRLAARWKRGAPAPSPADVSIDLPDSNLVRSALAECESECTPAVMNHSIRCYGWGVLLGAQQGLAFDREALGVAALLHDVELGRTDRRAGFSCCCFACAGAAHARGFLAGRSLDPGRIDRICDAIAMHLNPNVPPQAGAEAHLLNGAAAMDVVGASLKAIHARDQRRVLNRAPRLTFKADMLAAMTRERGGAPETRAHLLMNLGFGKMIAGAPFDG